MKNRGYALSAIVYPLLLVCLVLILSILFNLNNKKNLLNSLKDEVKNEVAFVNKIPTAPIITGGSTNWSSSAKTISVSKPSTAMSGINNYQYCIGTSTNGCDGTWTDLASGTTSASISTNGIRYIYFRAISKSGREGQSSLYQTTMIDTEGPSIPTTGAIGNVSGSNTTGTIQTEASGSTDSESGDITYKYLVTNTNTTPSKDDEGFTTSKTFTRSCGTTYYAWAISEDSLGNRSEVKSLGSTSDGANSYSAWGSCSKTCGGGTQTRTNTCALITDNLSQACNEQSCCSSTTYTDTNGAWGSCSKTCGGGTKNYTVTRTYYSAYDGSYCSQTKGLVTNTQSCNTQSCCAYSAGKVWNYGYTGGVQSFTVPCSGTYKLEVWGAQGGSSGNSSGGAGGYSYGNINLTNSSNLYIIVGGQGSGYHSTTYTYYSGGYNGGGGIYTGDDAYGNSYYNSTGGGATHIATTNRGVLSNYSSYRSEVLIVAGGGGGGNGTSSNESGRGGSGGGSSGGVASGNTYSSGSGGTQTSAGTNGSFGTGGLGLLNRGYQLSTGAGGGGGWYGGGTGDYSSAGGGSGYLNTSLLISGTTGMSNGARSGNGYARITLVSISS